MKRNKIILYAAILLIAVGTGFVFLKGKTGKNIVTFETAPVTQGTISNTVTATGTVEPVKQVSVGTQVSGVIQKIYVDYNSRVTKGQLLAELDKTPLIAQLASVQADLQSAESQITYQEANFNRIKQLYNKRAISETDYETALFQYNTAQANVAKMKSEVERAQTNLNYARIYSPIDGVVLSRAVDEGQTVAASFNTPTLFTIAQDLTKMQVVANVDEADIGQVKEGQKVTFTVDAYPDDQFSGTVKQVRLLAVTNANVVTYSVVIDAPNPDLKLKPGLTASIIAYTREANDVLTIPAKALRFKPDSTALSQNGAPIQPAPGKMPESAINPSSDKTAAQPEPAGEHRGLGWKAGSSITNHAVESIKTVWIKEGNAIHPVEITTGLTDETNVEVKSGLKAGDLVVVSESESSTATVTTAGTAGQSPFMPKRPSKK